MKCKSIFSNQGDLAHGNWHMYNYNLHSSYLNWDILDQVEHTVNRRSLFPRNKVRTVFGEWPHWTGKLAFSGFWWFPHFFHNSSVLWPFSGKSWSSGCLFFFPRVGQVFLCFLIQTERFLWFDLSTEYKMPSLDYIGIHEGIQTVGASSCLFLPFAGEEQVVPAGFRGRSPEIDEYFLQNRGPQHCSIQIMYQDVKWDFLCGHQLVAKVKIWGQKECSTALKFWKALPSVAVSQGRASIKPIYRECQGTEDTKEFYVSSELRGILNSPFFLIKESGLLSSFP